MQIRSVLYLLAAVAIASPLRADVAPAEKTETMTKEAHEAWKKLSEPGEGHAIFKDLVGNWKYTMQMWQAADAPAVKATGTTTNKLVFGGRFLQGDTKSTVMGKKFEGMGLTGFDNLKQQYQSLWIDNMSTAMMTTTGTFDATTKTLAETGTMSDAMTNQKDRWFRTEMKLLNKKAYTYTMFTKNTEGKEFKMMEIEYKR